MSPLPSDRVATAAERVGELRRRLAEAPAPAPWTPPALVTARLAARREPADDAPSFEDDLATTTASAARTRGDR